MRFVKIRRSRPSGLGLPRSPSPALPPRGGPSAGRRSLGRGGVARMGPGGARGGPAGPAGRAGGRAAGARAGVRRVFLRHDALEEDVVLACEGLATVGEVGEEAGRALGALGVRVPAEGFRDLRRKADHRRLEPRQLVADQLEDSAVVLVDYTGARAPPPPHVKVRHPKLNSNILVWVPLFDLAGASLEQVRLRAERMMQRSDPALRISGLVRPSASENPGNEQSPRTQAPLPLVRPWEESLRPGDTVVATPGKTLPSPRTRPRRKRRDSVVFANPDGQGGGGSFAEPCPGGGGGDATSPFGEDDQIDGDLSLGSTPRDLQHHVDNPLHETLRSGEKVRVSGDGDVTEFMSKLPGGSWAVFSGDATPLGQGKSFSEVHAIEMSPR